ncbi:hypothetical protein [Brevibacillus sp. SYSU BS000544]|uniref:hypothetical protein n=1 Tax=Brevibacillus sp. SYSU BS000544 TaxID=3416443 RepID=UPI003CE4D830
MKIFKYLFLFTLLFSLSLQPVFASEPEGEDLEVDLTVTSSPVRMGETISFQAVSKKFGDSFEADFTIGGSDEPLEHKSRVEGDKLIFTSEWYAEGHGNTTVQFKIKMTDSRNGDTWVGEDTITLLVEDEMPEVIQPAKTTIHFSPNKQPYDIGQKIRFSIYTDNKGEILNPANIVAVTKHKGLVGKITDVKTVLTSKKDRYLTTGYFIPTVGGEHEFVFRLDMLEGAENGYTGLEVKKFTVNQPGIKVIVTPNKATMKSGQVIFLVVQCHKVSNEAKISWNHDRVFEKQVDFFPPPNEYITYHLFVFEPMFNNGTYNLEMTVEDKGKVGKAKVKVVVE